MNRDEAGDIALGADSRLMASAMLLVTELPNGIFLGTPRNASARG